MTADAELSREAAARVPRLAEDMAAALVALGPSGGLPPQQRLALDSYAASAANEIAITETLMVMAETLAEQGLTPAVQEGWAEVDELLRRRLDLEQRRLARLP